MSLCCSSFFVFSTLVSIQVAIAWQEVQQSYCFLLWHPWRLSMPRIQPCHHQEACYASKSTSSVYWIHVFLHFMRTCFLTFIIGSLALVFFEVQDTLFPISLIRVHGVEHTMILELQIFVFVCLFIALQKRFSKESTVIGTSIWVSIFSSRKSTISGSHSPLSVLYSLLTAHCSQDSISVKESLYQVEWLEKLNNHKTTRKTPLSSCHQVAWLLKVTFCNSMKSYFISHITEPLPFQRKLINS